MKKRILYTMVLTAGLLFLGASLVSWTHGHALRAQFLDTRNSVRALALGPDGSLYVGTFGNGIYRSPDEGAHWEKVSSGLTDPYVLTVVVGSGHEIFAGTARKGVFQTTDGSHRWKAINSGLTDREVPVLLVQGDTLYAGTGNGVFRSTNRGQQWEAYNTGLKRVLVRSMVMDSRGFLFAGTGGRGLYQRSPSSPMWEQLTRGFRGSLGILENFIRTLTLGPDDTIYAGTFDGGVYVSRDRGKQWTWWSAGMTNESIRALVVGPDETIYAGTGKGIFVRTPSDARWRSISQDLEDDVIESMVVGKAGQIYAGTRLGLYKGTIRGDWTVITPGFSRIQDRGIMIDPTPSLTARSH